MSETFGLKNCFGGKYRGRRVLVTGHTGFKGSWLALWLRELGAEVIGYSLPAPTEPSHYELLDVEIDSHVGDVRDLEQLSQVIRRTEPELVFHLAAQPLVRLSYEQPVETFDSNIRGTVNTLQASCAAESVRAVVCITSDKVYENLESETGYRESDRLGGHDPYSCSKACCELVVHSFRESLRPVSAYGDSHDVLIATARAGNVIGGGDWALDRLIPDAVRAAARDEPLMVRSPTSVRPWQHVLEPLAGYLMLGDALLGGETQFAQAWNFGPDDEGNVCVADVVDQMQGEWPSIRFETPGNSGGPHETKVLKLDSRAVRSALKWEPVWGWQESVSRTARWYRSFYESGQIDSLADLQSYCDAASNHGLGWAS